MNETDGKSELLGGVKKGSLYVADLHDADEELNRAAAEACPMRIIRFEKSSNMKLDSLSTSKKQVDDLERIRGAINKIDASILQHLSQRMDLVRELGELKKSADLPIIDKEREKVLFARLEELGREYGLSSVYIHDLWEIVLRESIQEQKKLS